MFRFKIFVLLAFLFFMPYPAHAAGSIGVVDVFDILSNSKAAKDIQAQQSKLRDQFLSEISKTEQELRTEEKEILEQRTQLSQEDYLKKRQAYEAKLLQIRKMTQEKKRRLEQASNKAMDELRDQLYIVVQSIATERGFELVISNKNVIAGEKSLDITKETMERLNKTLQKIPLKLEEE